jgi:hypothetical protein
MNNFELWASVWALAELVEGAASAVWGVAAPRVGRHRGEGAQVQPETRDELTAQEEQLARDGPSNPEIGGQLFLSAARSSGTAQGVPQAGHRLPPAASGCAVP